MFSIEKNMPKNVKSKNSFTFNGWLRLRTLCKALRQTEDQLIQLKQQIDAKLKVAQQNIDKRSDVQASRTSIENVENFLEAKKCSVMTLSARLSLIRRRFGLLSRQKCSARSAAQGSYLLKCKLLPKSHAEICKLPLSISGVHLPGAENYV
uniref:Uncharacterized protein n=1 Tax=Romanomermis culicivorax TaxID=13658 RepID=A0A915JUI3_ROMCU